jgi:hypothetical protein
MEQTMRYLSAFAVLVSFVNVVPAEEAPNVPPQEVYAAYQKALTKGDGKAALACLTAEERMLQLYEAGFAASAFDDERLIKKHTDIERKDAWLKEHGRPETIQGCQQLFFEMLRDPDAFYTEAIKLYREQVVAKDVEKEPIRNVKISGNRARGVVTRSTESIRRNASGEQVQIQTRYDSPVYFAKTKEGWKIDTPTKDEAAKEIRRLEGGIEPIEPERR